MEIELMSNHMSSIIKLETAFLFALGGMISAFICCSPAADAQGIAQEQFSRQRKIDKEEYSTQGLKAPVDLPNVPTYTGRTVFAGGCVVPRARSGCCYIQHFSAREKAQEIIAWYQAALAQNNWKIEPGMQSERSTAATDAKGNICQIFAMPTANEKGYLTDFVVQYTQAR